MKAISKILILHVIFFTLFYNSAYSQSANSYDIIIGYTKSSFWHSKNIESNYIENLILSELGKYFKVVDRDELNNIFSWIESENSLPGDQKLKPNFYKATFQFESKITYNEINGLINFEFSFKNIQTSEIYKETFDMKYLIGDTSFTRKLKQNLDLKFEDLREKIQSYYSINSADLQNLFNVYNEVSMFQNKFDSLKLYLSLYTDFKLGKKALTPREQKYTAIKIAIYYEEALSYCQKFKNCTLQEEYGELIEKIKKENNI